MLYLILVLFVAVGIEAWAIRKLHDARRGSDQIMESLEDRISANFRGIAEHENKLSLLYGKRWRT